MNESVDLLVVTVTYNSSQLLPDFVEALNTELLGITWRLVVADNESTDDTVERLREQAPAATLVRMGCNAGYAAGINAAVAAGGRSRAVLALNPDVRIGPQCVQTLLEELRDPSVGIAVPRLVDGSGKLIYSMRREPTLLRAIGDALIGADRAGRFPRLGEVVSDSRLYEKSVDVDWAEGSTQLISAQCWDLCGPWDESFFLYSEETDFDLRASDAGLRIRYVPSAPAIHLEGGSSSSPQLWAILTTNRVRLFHKRNGLISTLLFWLTLLIREASRSALGRKTSRAAMRALLDPRLLGRTPGPGAIT